MKIATRGMVNRGNTCFVNAALQVLVHCKPLASLLGVISKYEDSLVKSAPLCVGLARLCRDLQRTSAPIAPRHVDDAARAMGPRGLQYDAQEFADRILSGMHEELQRLCKETRENTPAVTPESAVDTAEDDGEWEEVGHAGKSHIVLQRAADFARSPITEIFGGVVQAMVKRAGARATASSTPFVWLPVDISHSAVNDVTGALTASMHAGAVVGEKASSGSAIVVLPPVLLLHLKRFEYDPSYGVRKVQKRIAYEQELTISQRIAAAVPAAQRRYRLIGVVHHHGTDVQSGHYTADVLTADGWISCDDQRLSALGDPSTTARFATAYLLVYERI